jgi:hypothetical protein
MAGYRYGVITMSRYGDTGVWVWVTDEQEAVLESYGLTRQHPKAWQLYCACQRKTSVQSGKHRKGLS